MRGHHLWLFALAGAILVPSFLWGPGNSDSRIYNAIWTEQIGTAFAHGEIYPRWLPDSFEGLGSPTFYFYPPRAFFLSGAFGAFGMGADLAINIAALLALFASGSAMWAWLSFHGARSLLGASLYMLAPYHLTDFYARGALAEFAAFAWLPLIGLGIEALPKRWAAVLLGVSVAGLIMTHLPSAVLAALFLALPLAVLKWRRDRSALLPGLMAVALGLGLAAVYLLPALTLQRYVSAELLWTEYYQPSHWYVWNWKESWLDWENQPHTLLFMPPAALGALLVSLRSRSIWTAIVAVSGLAAFGLLPIWDLAPLAKVQFPWRVLGIMEFAAVTALAVALPRPSVCALVIILLMPADVYLISKAWKWFLIQESPRFEQMRASMQDAPEYLPRGFDTSGVTGTQRSVDLAPYRDLSRAAAIVVDRPGQMTIGRSAFPIWRVTRDGMAVPTRGPLLTFDAVPGVYRIERVWLWQEVLGALISGLAVAALSVPLVLRSRRLAGGGAELR